MNLGGDKIQVELEEPEKGKQVTHLPSPIVSTSILSDAIVEHLTQLQCEVRGGLEVEEAFLELQASLRTQSIWEYVQGKPHLFEENGLYMKKAFCIYGPLHHHQHLSIPPFNDKTFRYDGVHKTLELCLEPAGHVRIGEVELVEGQRIRGKILRKGPGFAVLAPSGNCESAADESFLIQVEEDEANAYPAPSVQSLDSNDVTDSASSQERKHTDGSMGPSGCCDLCPCDAHTESMQES
ncbi:unnamed protein product [Darwinula stevensoni]|uniref:Uncharacterized protein n=1 Tax=Darwinula stevensoni TaxID=69355 RepID=A0A7R9A3F4_9CRUS|nr:unnamed protein product [Darwinula stevensoni]CAG0882006.1 unnamed protein product [Darwinula stevensoni]